MKQFFYLLTLCLSIYACGSTASEETNANTTTDEEATATKKELPADVINGLFVYYAGVAQFYPCGQKKSIPLLMEADYPKLERTYTQLQMNVQERLYVELKGAYVEREKMEGEGTEQYFKVNKFLGYKKGVRCPE